MTEWIWLALVGFGATALGLALFHGTRQTARHEQDPGEVQRTEKGTKRLYEEQDRIEKAEEMQRTQ